MSKTIDTPAVPDWRDESLGTRIRVALWLSTEVGEGKTFKKQQLRDAMPGVEQIDRRMRDLRPAGWQILTYRDLNALGSDELLLEKIGAPVWEPMHRGAGLRAINAKVRQEVFKRDLNRCIRCGTFAGEPYPDDPTTTARLTLGHVNPHKHGSTASAADLVTECARCNESVKHLTDSRLSLEQVWDRVTELGKRDKEWVLTWLEAGRREASPAERVLAQVLQLPGVHRQNITERLKGYFTRTDFVYTPDSPTVDPDGSRDAHEQPDEEQ
ncbi:HNH endonuclease [Paenarthrobacter nicotinovorans]|uniref:HNH endonuclease n=1 Tax=Paenarthrobacter nicotinovorans TaxID=29320 RepID=UPI003D679894